MPRDVSTSVLAHARTQLRGRSGLAQLLRSFRAVIHFGPWRRLARAVIRVVRPPRREVPEDTLCPDVEVSRVVASLRTDGMCLAGALPRPIVERLRIVTDPLPRGEYGAFHEANPDIARLVRDPAVLSVARQYLGAEPELLECNLVVQHAPSARRVSRPVGPMSQQRFHFDYAGWHSLNLFVYLTDVDDSSGAHQIALGTHRHKSLRDAIRPSLDDDEALQRFGPRICTITGRAGTMFFEDTEAFHRRVAITQRRVLLNILFASHRSLFSRGRLVRPFSARTGPAS